MEKEALLYEKLDGSVKCGLCAHRCKINDGMRGICGVRENRKGVLYTLVYSKAIASHVDPIEKKPFFHFYPGSYSFSIATAGCNFRCRHCQNSEISQLTKHTKRIAGEFLPPEEVVKLAKEEGTRGISYTYTEPTIFFEYAYDTAKLARKENLYNNFVTNGYMTAEALNMINPYLDAANVDVKAFTEKFYKDICGASLEPVLESIKLMKKSGIWVEVTTLVIPTLNDSDDEFLQIAEFIKGVDPGIPWHVSRFHPDYELINLPMTPTETLNKARKIGLEAGLRYVYTGNIPGDSGENTYCYNCGKMLIKRLGFSVIENKIKDSKCYNCGANIDGVGL